MRKFLLLLVSLALSIGLRATEVTDVLTWESFTTTSGTSYATYTCTGTSGTKYEAQFAPSERLQFRSSNSNSGLINTTSVGKVKKIEIKWNSGTTTSTRTFNVRGADAAFAITDMYGNPAAGEAVCSFVKSDGDKAITIEDDLQFSYIGMRSASGALYIDEIAITWELADADAVMKPVFSPASGTVEAGTEVSISCATEGAKIYYTTDETVPTAASTEYTAPIVINDYTVIKAVAIKNGKSSDVATATYTLPLEVESLTSLTDFPNGTEFKMMTALTVVYVNGAYVYVYDGSSYGLLYKYDTGLEAGDVIKPGFSATVSIYSGLVEFVPSSAFEKDANKGTVPQPTSIEPSMAAAIAAYSQNSYWMITNVLIPEATPSDKSNFYGYAYDEDGGEIELTFRNNFQLESVDGGYYNVICFVGIFNGTVQYYPVEYIPNVMEIESLSSISDFEEGTKVKMAANVTIIYADVVNKLVYVTDGVSNLMLGLLEADESLVPGTVIESGWEGAIASKMGVQMIEVSTDIETGSDLATVKQPMVVDPEEAEWMLAAYNANAYLTLQQVDFAQAPNGAQFSGAIYADDMIDVEFYNIFGIEGSASAGVYNVTGFVAGAQAFFPISLEEYVAEIEDLSPISDAEEGTAFKMLGNLTVIYANSGKAYVTDGTYNVLLTYNAANTTLTPGTVIEGGWQGVVTTLWGVKALAPSTTLALAADKVNPKQPIEVEGEDVEFILAPYMANQYVKVLSVNLADATPASGTFTGTVDNGATTITLENKFGLAPVEAGVYNATGFVGANGQLIVTSLEKVVLTIDNFLAITDLPLGVEFAFDGNAYVLYSNDKIAYLTDGQANIMVTGTELGIATADKLASGWHGVTKMVNRQLQVSIVWGLQIDGKQENMRAAIPVEADDAKYLLGENNLCAYLKLTSVELLEALPAKGNAAAVMTTSDGKSVNVTLRNELGIAPVEAGFYNVTGFVGIYEYTDLFFPTELEAIALLDDLSPISDLEAGTVFTMNTALTTIYGKDGIAYLTDGVYNVMLTDSNVDLTAGDVVEAGWQGEIAVINGVNTLKATDYLSVADEKGTVKAAYVIDPDEAEMMLAAYNMNAYLTLNGVTIAETNDSVYTAKIGDLEVTLYNLFGLDAPVAGFYNVTGFVGQLQSGDDTKVVFIPVAFEAAVDGLGSITIDGSADAYYTIQGVKVANPVAGQVYIQVKAGKATKVRF